MYRLSKKDLIHKVECGQLSTEDLVDYVVLLHLDNEAYKEYISNKHDKFTPPSERSCK